MTENFNGDYGELTRISNKMRKLLLDTKQKNRLRSMTEASEFLADAFIGIKRKKKMRQRIIKEIEF